MLSLSGILCSTGGTTAVIDMPLNSHPVTTTREHLEDKVEYYFFVFNSVVSAFSVSIATIVLLCDY